MRHVKREICHRVTEVCHPEVQRLSILLELLAKRELKRLLIVWHDVSERLLERHKFEELLNIKRNMSRRLPQTRCPFDHALIHRRSLILV